MTFFEMIAKLGIESYPDTLPEIFAREGGSLDVSPEALSAIDKEHNVCGERLPELIACAAEVAKDDTLLEYTRCAVAYLRVANHHEGGRLRLPALDENTPLYHYPTMLLAFAMPAGIKSYRDRGFPEEEVQGAINAFRARINVKDSKTGLSS